MVCLLGMANCYGEASSSLPWRVTRAKPLIIISPDHTPYHVTIIAAESTPVKVDSTKNVQILEEGKSPVEVNDEHSVTASGKGKKPVTVASPGDNILTIKNLSDDNSPVTVFVTSANPETLAAPFRTAINNANGNNGVGPVIMNVASSDVIPLSAPQPQNQEVKPTPSNTALIGLSLIIGSSIVGVGFLCSLWLYQRGLLPRNLSDAFYSCYEFFRRISYRTYAKVFATEPKRIL